jgi:type IV pilus assembly protein PilW
MSFKPVNRGFTLIELLLAMTLGLILVIAITMVFSSVKYSYLLQTGLTRVQEDGRIAMFLIAEEVRKAGFRKPVWNEPLSGYSPLTAASVNGANGANDTLQIMYLDDRNCFGTLNEAFDPETAEPRVDYKRVTFSVDNAENLKLSCEYGGNPGSLQLQVSNETIIDGVESFQVLYGIDTDFPPDFSINGWTTADTITPNASVCLQSQYLCEAGGLLNNMQSGVPLALKFGILVASPENVGADSDSQPVKILDVVVAARNDYKLRKLFTTTVTLRNLTL